jgi:hypothetical protein
MRKNNQSKFLTGIFTAFMLIIMGMNADAQCRFVQVRAEVDTTFTSLPCDFPVLNFVSAGESEREAFKTIVSNWKSTHPGFDSLSFFPLTTHEYFEISQSDFDNFSLERKSIISAVPFFYKIN